MIHISMYIKVMIQTYQYLMTNIHHPHLLLQSYPTMPVEAEKTNGNRINITTYVHCYDIVTMQVHNIVTVIPYTYICYHANTCISIVTPKYNIIWLNVTATIRILTYN